MPSRNDVSFPMFHMVDLSSSSPISLPVSVLVHFETETIDEPGGYIGTILGRVWEGLNETLSDLKLKK